MDKFHVIRMASAALDAARKEEGKKLSDSKLRQVVRGRHFVQRWLSDLAERETFSCSRACWPTSRA